MTRKAGKYMAAALAQMPTLPMQAKDELVAAAVEAAAAAVAKRAESSRRANSAAAAVNSLAQRAMAVISTSLALLLASVRRPVALFGKLPGSVVKPASLCLAALLVASGSSALPTAALRTGASYATLSLAAATVGATARAVTSRLVAAEERRAARSVDCGVTELVGRVVRPERKGEVDE